ncbi:MAG: hypothetical protein AAFR93_09290 [Pseudomonadota bacterium]
MMTMDLTLLSDGAQGHRRHGVPLGVLGTPVKQDTQDAGRAGGLAPGAPRDLMGALH